MIEDGDNNMLIPYVDIIAMSVPFGSGRFEVRHSDGFYLSEFNNLVYAIAYANWCRRQDYRFISVGILDEVHHYDIYDKDHCEWFYQGIDFSQYDCISKD